ncbi:MAG: DUF4189 domain-containing protein, partial [Fimbriiglobus sp.]
GCPSGTLLLPQDDSMLFGACVFSPSSESHGCSYGHSSAEAAVAAAHEQCGQPDARVLVCEANAWMALAVSPTTGACGAGCGTSPDIARHEAKRVCGLRAADGVIQECFHTTDGRAEDPSAGTDPGWLYSGLSTILSLMLLAGNHIYYVISGKVEEPLLLVGSVGLAAGVILAVLTIFREVFRSLEVVPQLILCIGSGLGGFMIANVLGMYVYGVLLI